MSIRESFNRLRIKLRQRTSHRDVSRSVAVLALSSILLVPAFLIPSGKAHSSPPLKYHGVNLASAEFAPTKLPGVHGKDYVFPSRSTAAPFRAMGMNSVRLPILWERLQPTAFGPLDAAELARLDASIADLSGFELVIVDVHNYARYFSVALDQKDRSGAMLADLWKKLAARYKSSPKIAFGIMNEPHGIDGAAWRAIADETVVAIRKAGAKNLILVPGVNWTGGHSWQSGGKNSSATAMAGFMDPAGNFMFEIHQYLDGNSSGEQEVCVNEKVGRARLADVTNWLRNEGAKGFLGEFGAGANPRCLAALDDMLTFLGENGDVWIGWTYWAAGDWWGDYHFSIQPDGSRPRPQSAILARHLPK